MCNTKQCITRVHFICVYVLFQGEGDFDIPFIRDHLRNLEYFCGVEVRESAVTCFREKLNKLSNRNIQVIL